MLILSYAEPDSDLSLQLTAKLALLRVPAHSVSDLCAQLTLHVMLVKNCPVTLSSTLLPVYLASGVSKTAVHLILVDYDAFRGRMLFLQRSRLSYGYSRDLRMCLCGRYFARRR